MCLSLYNQSSIKANEELDHLYLLQLPIKDSIDWKLAKNKEVICINDLDGNRSDLIDLIY